MSTPAARPPWWTDQATRHSRAVAGGLELFESALRHTQWDSDRLSSLVAARRQALARRAGLADVGELATSAPLTKARLRADPAALLTGEVDPADYLTVRTSGTTGIPTVVHHSEAYLVERVAQRMRMFEAYGIPWHPRTLIVLAKPGRPLLSFGTSAGGSAGTVVAVNVSAVDDTNAHYVDAVIHDLDPHLLAGQSMELLGLAELVEAGSLTVPGAATAISQGDVLEPRVRETIERACEVRLYDTYGLQETGQVAFECPQVPGAYHVNAEAVDLDVDHSGGLLVTSLVNEAMSLVRYETGDHVDRSAAPCACGRALPVISSIHGRRRPLIRGADGRRSQVTRLQTLVSTTYGEIWQIRHDTPGTVILRVVTDAAPDAHEHLVREARAAYDIALHVERVDTGDLLAASGKLERYAVPTGAGTE